MKALPMPYTTCRLCNTDVLWSWEEAFDKFGFSDGEGEVMTCEVADALEQAGYEVTSEQWGLHNEVILSIRKDGVEQIPIGTNVGYDEPRRYLPLDIVQLLDEQFCEGAVE